MDLWRLLLLSFFVQFEIRVELQSEYCRYDVDSPTDVTEEIRTFESEDDTGTLANSTSGSRPDEEGIDIVSALSLRGHVATMVFRPRMVHLSSLANSRKGRCCCLCGLRVPRLGLMLFLCCCGGCLYYHSSCNWRFVSSCKVNMVGTKGYVERIR